MGKKSYARMNYFQDNIASRQRKQVEVPGRSPLISIFCENGLVHYCSQQRGYPGKPSLAEYTKDDIRREFITEKSCAPRCTVACVHYTSYMDFWRAPQTIAAPPPNSPLVQVTLGD